MRTLAVSVAAILVLAVVSPAFAQPFADVPTDHWAFDAIAELAAKGIIEGFPDGTFKGDRGVTRYEVAMIVARILARIEAIKIPTPTAPAAPTAPQVTRADVQTIQRLVNEFRAELAALGVRVTAVEEELTALKTKTTNVAVKGDVRFRYNVFNAAGATSVRYRNRLTFTGNAGGNVTAVARASFGGGGGGLANIPACTVLPCAPQPGAGQRAGRFDFDLAGPQFMQTVNFDLAYLDLKGVYGLDWRLGQQAYTLSGVGWSGYGLLYDPSNADVFQAVGVADGLKAAGNWGGFSFELGLWREVGAFPASSSAPVMDIWTARVETDLLAGWKVGGSYLMQRRNAATTVPITAASASGATGTATGAAFTNDSGYQVDIAGDLFPGLSLGGAYASFNPDASAGASSNSYIAWVALDLSSMGMSMMSPTLTAWYKDYGSTTAGAGIPFHSGASTENSVDAALDWNFTGWGAALEMKVSPGLAGTVQYETGNQKVGNAAVTEYYASLDYSLASNTTLSLRYFNTKLGAAQTSDFYRVQLTYSY